MTDLEDVYEYLPGDKVKRLYVTRLLTWLESFGEQQTQSSRLLAVCLLVWCLMHHIALD